MTPSMFAGRNARLRRMFWRKSMRRWRGFRQAVRRRWSALGHRRQHFVINLAIGLAIECALSVVHNMPAIVSARNWAIDTSTQTMATLGGPARSAHPITVIDVDDETWRNPVWGGGEPDRAPGAAVGQLLRYAAAGHPDAIVLDIVVENPVSASDADLARTLERMSRQQDSPPVLLVRTLRDPLPMEAGRLAELRSSALDRTINAAPGRLVRVAPYFRTSSDGILREWQLWRLACSDALSSRGETVIVPSVQLALAALRRPMAAPLPTTLRNRCDDGKVADRAAHEAMTGWFRTRPDITSRPPDENNEGEIDLASRIVFTASVPTVSDRVQVVSALKILEHARQIPRDLRGRIVIIGQSHEAARDAHATPLGMMSGAMVLANAALSLESVGLVAEAPVAIDLPLKMLLIAITAAVFARWRSLPALFIIFVPFSLFVGGISYAMLYAGCWFDFAVPLIGLYSHRLIAAFEEEFLRRAPHDVHETTE